MERMSLYDAAAFHIATLPATATQTVRREGAELNAVLWDGSGEVDRYCTAVDLLRTVPVVESQVVCGIVQLAFECRVVVIVAVI